MVGKPALNAAFLLLVFPHITPNIAKSMPDIPAVGLPTYIGR